MNETSYIEAALSFGFTAAMDFDVATLDFSDAEVLRDACRADDCHLYGRSWACPPAVGTVAKVVSRVCAYRRGVAVQLLTEPVNPAFDAELFAELTSSFNAMLRALRAQVAGEQGETLALGLGNCTLCEHCPYPRERCCHRAELIPCISGHCINVYRLWDSGGRRRGRLDENEFYGIILYR